MNKPLKSKKSEFKYLVALRDVASKKKPKFYALNKKEGAHQFAAIARTMGWEVIIGHK
mgnify:CR=1 FL=1